MIEEEKEAREKRAAVDAVGSFWKTKKKCQKLINGFMHSSTMTLVQFLQLIAKTIFFFS